AKYPFAVPGGNHVIMKDDFRDDIKVVPVNKPTLQNSSARFLQAEMILNQAKTAPEVHDLKYAYEYFYRNMAVPPEEIQKLIGNKDEQQEAFSGDPITENQFALVGKPIKAEIFQAHEAHIATHSLLLNNPNVPD